MRAPIRPGKTLREDLDALGMSAAELARRIEVPVNRITEILNGRRSIAGDTALRLGRFFGTSGEFRLNLRKLYELRLCRTEARHDDRPAANAGGRGGPARDRLSAGAHRPSGDSSEGRIVPVWVRRLLALAADRRGVSTVEYALIVVAIIALVGGVAAAMSNSYNNLFTNLGADISNVVT